MQLITIRFKIDWWLLFSTGLPEESGNRFATFYCLLDRVDITSCHIPTIGTVDKSGVWIKGYPRSDLQKQKWEMIKVNSSISACGM